MGGELTVRKVWDLPLREVSGICERAGGDGRPRQLLAVIDPGPGRDRSTSVT